ncbi:MAG: TonB-dependent receptor, partial [Gammaproteobacteria bacterium]
MRGQSNAAMRRTQLSVAVSLALASLVSNAVAQEQSVAAEGEVAKVTVVGARASQQSAIDRKKNAATALDSIIAEDVGAFPDRNVGEAISRVAGIALDRGDFGEGVNVSVRGNGPDLTRVEIDGQGVQAGGANLDGRGEGRGVELRELSSDLIKSVDVVKGSTAEMTEGSLGGGIIIKTRTGLDFKKRFYSLRLSGGANTINKEITPDLNLVLADKFLNDRLGIVFNGNSSKLSNEGHSMTAGGTNNTAGKLRLLDFDNSPDKTFSYDPNLLTRSDASADTPIAVTDLPEGVDGFGSTPRSILTRSAAAKTKADCYAAFPALTAAQTASLPEGKGRNNAITQRGNELLSCLNQWNDFTPNLIRYFVKRQVDERKSGDLRVDFKVNEALTVYAKGSASKRSIDEYNGNYSLGGLTVNPANVITSNGSVPAYTETPDGVRTATPGIGYYTYPSTASFRANKMPASGAIANVDPSSVVVDENHHVTKYTITDGVAGTDMTKSHIDTDAQYFQAGGTYRNGGFKAEFFGGDARSKLRRMDRRVSVGQNYGRATISVLPDGSYGYEFPADSTFNQLDYDAYARLSTQAKSDAVNASPTNPVAIPAYTSAQKPLVTPSIPLSLLNARETRTGERTGKLDLSFAPNTDRLPFVSTLKAGVKYTDATNKSWFTGGQTLQDPVGTFGKAGFQPGVYLPNNNLRSTVIGCQDTPGSLAPGGQKCQYGYNPSTNPTTALQGQMVLTPQQYRDLIAQSLVAAPNAQFYHGSKDRPAGMLDGWTTFDVDKFYQLAGLPNFNLDCLKACVGSDGKTYAQPFEAFREKTTAGYLMGEFDIDRIPFTSLALPFGMQLSGNAGVRYVKVDAQGSGFLTFTSIRKVQGAYDPANPSAPGGTVSTTYRKSTTITSKTTDWMPIYNLALWAVPDQLVFRYNHAKTIARPGISRLLPSGTCIYDERIANAEDGDSATGDQRCTGTMGNPGLKPFTNSNRNLSVEWYANRDTMFSAAVFRQVGKIGPGTLVVTKQHARPFAGSDAVDPGTGVPLRDLEFTFNQWENQPATTRKGVEFATKTAFTFLPSYLRYTGLDANYTRNKSTSSAATARDLLGGGVGLLHQQRLQAGLDGDLEVALRGDRPPLGQDGAAGLEDVPAEAADQARAGDVETLKGVELDGKT